MSQRPDVALEKIKRPEIIFGLVAPIGVNLELVSSALEHNLTRVGYSIKGIKLTSEMTQFEVSVELEDKDVFSYYDSRIRYANAIRARSGRDDALALLAIATIRRERATHSGDPNQPTEGVAYLIRQLKHPSEIDRLRSVYGRQFVVVCVYEPEDKRQANIIKTARANKYRVIDDIKVDEIARELIDRDYAELRVKHGQRIRDAFPKGDVFIDASDRSELNHTTSRFIDALFGKNSVSPTVEEYGMYLAKSASLRSLDLSRQVGAAILTSAGEIIALGSNEVPKAFGGTYWAPETDGRDFFQGFDPNETEKTRILLDIVQRMKAKKVLSNRFDNAEGGEILKSLLQIDSDFYVGDAKVLDIIEFGRTIHAEMSALCDAARIGLGVKGSHLYSTTFPCHICAKHIVACGIEKVVFLEPYPKSHAVSLHGDSISVDEYDEKKVWFKPFIGIAPHRYQDLFEKTRRKDRHGKSQEWYEGEPLPRMVVNTVRPYIETEKMLESALLGLIREKERKN